jgi:hypothetical protein
MMLPGSWFRSCVLGTIRSSFFLLPLTQGKKLGVPIVEIKTKRNKVPYKSATARMMNGLLSESSSIMVLPLGQKMGPGTITP